MRLGATITSERGKPVTKTGNEYVSVTVNDEKGVAIVKMIVDTHGFVYIKDSQNDMVRVLSQFNGKLVEVRNNVSDPYELVFESGSVRYKGTQRETNGNLNHGKEYDCPGCGATQQSWKGLCDSCKGTSRDD